jgi:hypothetical protein
VSQSNVQHVATVYPETMKLPEGFRPFALVGVNSGAMISVVVDADLLNVETRSGLQNIVQAFQHALFSELANRS